MKYEIVHCCGHTSIQQIYGPEKERERKIASLKEQVCPACWKELCDEESQKAARQAEENGWPKLKGSERQIEWAESLRSESAALFDEMIADAENRPEETTKNLFGKNIVEYAGYPEIPGLIQKSMRKAKDKILMETTRASVYIDDYHGRSWQKRAFEKACKPFLAAGLKELAERYPIERES